MKNFDIDLIGDWEEISVQTWGKIILKWTTKKCMCVCVSSGLDTFMLV